jgi:hypothetical protein
MSTTRKPPAQCRDSAAFAVAVIRNPAACDDVFRAAVADWWEERDLQNTDCSAAEYRTGLLSPGTWCVWLYGPRRVTWNVSGSDDCFHVGRLPRTIGLTQLPDCNGFRLLGFHNAYCHGPTGRLLAESALIPKQFWRMNYYGKKRRWLCSNCFTALVQGGMKFE